VGETWATAVGTAANIVGGRYEKKFETDDWPLLLDAATAIDAPTPLGTSLQEKTEAAMYS